MRLPASIPLVPILCAAVAACADPGPGNHSVSADDPAGQCLLSEPGHPPIVGLSTFTAQRADRGGDGPGAQAVTVVCQTSGPGGLHTGDVVELFLPNLRRGPVPTGRYHVRRGDFARDTTVPLDRIAWGRVSRGPGAGLTYAAEGGTIMILEATDETLKGAYRIALRIADSAHAATVTDPRLVVQGVFTAPAADVQPTH